jgi:zinc protease
MKQCFLAIIVCLLTAVSAQASLLNIQEVTSPSGIKAWLVEDKTVNLITIKFLFKGVGARNDPPEFQGLSRLLSNTLDEGAGDLDSTEFQSQLNKYSIGLSYSTGRDDFYGSLKTLTKYDDVAFDLLKLSLTKPRFDSDAVTRMIDSNKSRILQDMTDPEWMAARIQNDALYKNHPYGLNSGGTLSSLEKITPQLLRDKLSSQLTKDRLLVSVVGNISPKELAVVLDKIFSDLPNSKAALLLPKEINLTKTPQSVLYKHEMPQTILSLTSQGISHSDPDYFAAEVLNQIFGGGGFGSRLTEVIREQKGLTYGIYSSSSEMDAVTDFSIDTTLQNQNVAKVLNEIQSQMNFMKDKTVSNDELLKAKSFLMGSLPLNLTSTSKIADMLLSFQQFGLPKNYLDIRKQNIAKVTAADIQRVAKRVLNYNNFTIVAVGQPQNFKSTTIYTELPNVK